MRADIATPDLIVLLKGMFASMREAAADGADPAQRERVFAVLTDGLRRPA